MTTELEAEIDLDGATSAMTTRERSEVIVQYLENLDKILMTATGIKSPRPPTLLWANLEPWNALRVTMGEQGEDIASMIANER